MTRVCFPSTSPAYPFTHAAVDGEPLFWHADGAAWVRDTALFAEMALWLWFVGADPAAVEILEGKEKCVN